MSKRSITPKIVDLVKIANPTKTGRLYRKPEKA
jgi:hypothetical protein